MKIRKYNLIFFLIFIIAATACIRQTDPNAFVIEGKIKGANGLNIYLDELTVNQLLKVDSTIALPDGRFKFFHLPKETGFYLIKLQNGKFVTLMLGRGEKNNILADTATFPAEYRVEGTAGSEFLNDYFTTTAIRQKKLDSLSRVFVASQKLGNFYQIKLQLDSSLWVIFKNQQEFLKSLIRQNPASIASLLLLNQSYANKILLDENENFDLFKLLDHNLFAKYPGNSHVIKHHERVLKFGEEKAELAKTEASLAPGKPAPALNLNDVSGKLVSSANLNAEYILYDFWASWSPPCRAANLQLKAIYQKYHPKGFEIFAVSFDTNGEIWKKSIAIDKIGWINVTDLSGMNSPVRKLYNLPEKLPYFYLVDKDGKIVSKGFNITDLKTLLKEKFRK